MTDHKRFAEVVDLFKEYIDAYEGIFKLSSNNPEIIDGVYEKIKQTVINRYKIPVKLILSEISRAAEYRNRFLPGYVSLYKRLFLEFKPKRDSTDNPICAYFLYRKYKIIKDEKHTQFSEPWVYTKKYREDVHKEGTIFRAIMEDNDTAFIQFTELPGFNPEQTIYSDLYPCEEIFDFSLLELCCYHGAAKCFKILRTKFGAKFTKKCIHLAFASGSREIVNECIRRYKPDEICMRNAILAHNLDLVNYLFKGCKIAIDPQWCYLYKNIPAFMVYADHTEDFFFCSTGTVKFGLMRMSKYFIAHKDDFKIHNENVMPQAQGPQPNVDWTTGIEYFDPSDDEHDDKAIKDEINDGEYIDFDDSPEEIDSYEE